MYLNQYWKDERLAFSTNDEVLTLSGDFAEKIWVPDTFFANDKNRFYTIICLSNVEKRFFLIISISSILQSSTTHTQASTLTGILLTQKFSHFLGNSIDLVYSAWHINL